MPFLLRVTDGRQTKLESSVALSQAVDAIASLTGGSSLRGNLSGLFGLGFAPLQDDPIAPGVADALQREAQESIAMFGNDLDSSSIATLTALAALTASGR